MKYAQSRKLFYLASGLENIELARFWIKELEREGWTCTYNWTTHGSLQGKGNARLEQCARMEAKGVADAHVVIVLLPSGRGTHVELGIAAGKGRPIIICSNQYFRDFDNSKNDNFCCAFYHHPSVVSRLEGTKMLLTEADRVWDKFYKLETEVHSE